MTPALILLGNRPQFSSGGQFPESETAVLSVMMHYSHVRRKVGEWFGAFPRCPITGYIDLPSPALKQLICRTDTTSSPLFTKTESRYQIISLTDRACADQAFMNCCAGAAFLCSGLGEADARRRLARQGLPLKVAPLRLNGHFSGAGVESARLTGQSLCLPSWLAVN